MKTRQGPEDSNHSNYGRLENAVKRDKEKKSWDQLEGQSERGNWKKRLRRE